MRCPEIGDSAAWGKWYQSEWQKLADESEGWLRDLAMEEAQKWEQA